MKKLVILFWSLSFLLWSTFSYTQTEVSAAINQVMSRYNTNTQLAKLNAVIPKIGKLQLSNPPKETWDLLKQIEFAVRARISQVLESQIVIDFSPLNTEETILLNQMNQYRNNRWLPSLIANQKLHQAAQILADDMAEQGYFDHVSPQWVGYVQRLWLVGYEFEYISENLWVGGDDAALIVELRSKSPVHEKNLFHRDATEVWVAYETKWQNRVAVYASPKF